MSKDLIQRKQKKYIKNYYVISLFVNLLPLLIMVIKIGKVEGEAQLGYIAFGIWGIICAIIYTIYFAIPEFKNNWEKIGGLIFPTLILSLGLIKFQLLLILIILNLIMNGFFIFHLKKKTFANKV
jgi:hypothetical protein